MISNYFTFLNLSIFYMWNKNVMPLIIWWRSINEKIYLKHMLHEAYSVSVNLSRRELFLSIVCFCMPRQLWGRPAGWSPLATSLIVPVPSVESGVLRWASAEEQVCSWLLSIDLPFYIPQYLSSGSMCLVYQRLLKVGITTKIFS